MASAFNIPNLNTNGQFTLDDEIFNAYYEVWLKGSDKVRQNVRQHVINFIPSNETKAKYKEIIDYIEDSTLIRYIRDYHERLQNTRLADAGDDDKYKLKGLADLMAKFPDGHYAVVNAIGSKLIWGSLSNSESTAIYYLYRSIYIHYIKGKYFTDEWHSKICRTAGIS